ncbi:hypothetical protein QVD99_008277 [Batrachochytrium dendrobatidis]|nr:hypothetical protein O5D80_007151 [Batrachochytrium dendrobatidis]KAK5664729.1 hypothetical protein QVD99_008277 [Batrachochytrium dendrobatidis]
MSFISSRPTLNRCSNKLFTRLPSLLLLFVLVAYCIASVAANADESLNSLDFSTSMDDGYVSADQPFDSAEEADEEPDNEDKEFYYTMLNGAAGWAKANLWWTLPTMSALLTLNFLFMSHSVGVVLGEEHVVVRAIKLDKPADAVWKLITTQDQYPSWRRSVYAATFVKLKDMESKVLMEKTLTGSTFYQITEQKRNQLWVRSIHTPSETDHSWLKGGYWFAGKWTFELAPPVKGEKGCILYLTKQGIVKVPAVAFIWSIYGFDSDVHSYLKDLAKALDQKKLDIVRPTNGKFPF